MLPGAGTSCCNPGPHFSASFLFSSFLVRNLSISDCKVVICCVVTQRELRCHRFLQLRFRGTREDLSSSVLLGIPAMKPDAVAPLTHTQIHTHTQRCVATTQHKQGPESVAQACVSVTTFFSSCWSPNEVVSAALPVWEQTSVICLVDIFFHNRDVRTVITQ